MHLSRPQVGVLAVPHLLQPPAAVGRARRFQSRTGQGPAPLRMAPGRRSKPSTLRRPAEAVARASADDGAGEGEGRAGPTCTLPPAWMTKVNKATKYAVSASVAVTMFYQWNLTAAWHMVGSVLNAFVNKALKYGINAARPATGLHSKTDPGMPSSHAQSLAFLSAVPCLYWIQAASPWPLAAAALQGLALGLTALRVLCGYHTVEQVVVGYAAGVGSAVVWSRVGHAALPAIAASPLGCKVLVGAAVILAMMFIQLVVKPAKLLRKLLTWASSKRAAAAAAA